MIVVDTSVWIAALRRAESAEARHLRGLLDEDQVALAVPVRVEILSGASRRDRARLRSTLSALPLLYPSEGTWDLIDRWLDVAGAAGDRFGVGDLLVAAIAAERHCAIWSLDRDFTRMGRLGIATLHESSPRH